MVMQQVLIYLCCAPITTRRGIPESPKQEEQIPKTAQIPKPEKEHTKTTINEVRPCCLRPRGNEREILLI